VLVPGNLTLIFSTAENILRTVLQLRKLASCNEAGVSIERFLKSSHPAIFATFGDNLVIASIAQTTSFMMSLMGSFRDLFIMCISFALSHRFQQVNNVLSTHKGELVTTQSFWSKQREDYRKLARLIDEVDNCISNLTLLAYANNLFSICASLQESLM
jgi:Trehalose receptor